MTVQVRGSDKHKIRNKSKIRNSNAPNPLPFRISVLGICFVLRASDFELTLVPLPQEWHLRKVSPASSRQAAGTAAIGSCAATFWGRAHRRAPLQMTHGSSSLPMGGRRPGQVKFQVSAAPAGLDHSVEKLDRAAKVVWGRLQSSAAFPQALLTRKPDQRVKDLLTPCSSMSWGGSSALVVRFFSYHQGTKS